MGITRVANVTGLDDIGIPVVMVCRPNSSTLAVFQGKGITLDAARVSGVMEAAEYFHAEQIDFPCRRATWNALGRHAAVVDLEGLPLWRGAGLDGELSLSWVEGHDLMSGECCWVPQECVCVGGEQRGQLASTSNGLASGNSRMEALSHAICEVAERHATAVWQELPGPVKHATRVALTTIDDEACCWLLERFAQAEVAVGVWNMTCELGIPTFACYIVQRTVRRGRVVQPATGAGCHPAREVALARALTEAAQTRLTHIAGARDDMTPAQYTDGVQAGFIRHIQDFIDGGSHRHFAEICTRDERLVSDDVEWELGQLRGAGIRQVVAVELTQAKFGIPVVRVVIPGLRMPGHRTAVDSKRRDSGT